ncbi:MAG: outer membrane beta-barrel protein [Bacteroidales bacterium]|nr:outer membrane beta-barrel protein [Bacteroidales bacterium]
MRRNIYTSLLLAALLFGCLPFSAMAQKTGMIYGGLFNAFTREMLTGAKVTLMRADSSVVDSMVMANDYCADRHPAWHFNVPTDMEAHIVRFELEDYETCFLDIPAHKFKGRTTMKLHDAYIRRKPREQNLGEATVTATKVKFYMKKDTLVFNADAFQLAEGSMLDALISQLPGVELKDDGRILVNGKQVESLLLNGEDFFKGDNRIMLDNLPSYTVRTVQVYEKQGDVGRMVGKRVGDEQYVMDVRLKKQYSIGWMGNVEAGYSTEGNYLARLFAMRFTPQSRITLVGNINDVNDTRKPGQNSEWTPESMPSGLLTTRMAALDYLVKDKFKHFEVSGSVTANHSDASNVTRTAAEDFLPQGNTFERSESASKSHNVSVSTDHKLKFTPNDGLLLNFQPYFNYSKQRNRTSYAGATFSAQPEGYDMAALIDSIRQPQAGNLLRRLAVNRTVSEAASNGRSYDGGIDISSNIKMGPDVLQLNASVSASDARNETFDHYLLDYPSASTTDGTTTADYRNRWTKGHPDRSLDYTVGADYMLWASGQLLVKPGYSFGQTHTRRDNYLYRLDRLAGWGIDSDQALGVLPSETALLEEALDDENSYERRQTDTRHTAQIYVKDDRWFGENYNWLHFDVTLPLVMTHRRLDYARNTYDGVTTRHTVFFNPSAKVTYKWHDGARSVELTYRLRHRAPDMLYFLNIEDNADPLNIYNGNPDLKNTATHTVRLAHTNNSQRKQRYFSTSFNATFTRNAQAWAYTYDRATGVRTYAPENVNGNYVLSAGVDYAMPLDKKKRLTLSTATFAQLYHSVDLISIESAVAPSRSTVSTWWATETLRLDYRLGKVKAGVKAYGSWNRATSQRESFTPFTVWDFNYGPTVQVELPWDMQLATDLTVYSRRGYEDDAANTDDVVWNARLAKRVLKGNLTFAVDAFDILGQLSNLTQTVNSQGRVETWRNVTPRYVMVHVIYKLNIQPKKRAGE